MSPTASSIARSFLTHLHRDHQIHSMDGHDSPESDPYLSFDRHVSSLLLSLLPSGDQIPTPFLSLSWIHHLLSSFLLLLDEFNTLVFSTNLPKCPPLNRLISDYSNRLLKSLDLLNAVRDGLDRVRHSRVHLDTALSSLSHGQLHRAKKALTLISAAKDAVVPSHRHRSFSLHSHHPRHHHELRTLSWNVSVSRTWSASRQLSAIAGGLLAPKQADPLAGPVFTMSSLLLFVLWTLVAAIPCQDRGVHGHVSAPRAYVWAAPMISIQEKILEESRRKGNENVSGLMMEICNVENGARRLAGLLKMERMDEQEKEVKAMERARKGLEGLDGLDRLVREAFLRIVRSRTDGLEFLPR